MRIPITLLEKYSEAQTELDSSIKNEVAIVSASTALELDGNDHFLKRRAIIAESSTENFEDAFERYLGENDLLPISYLQSGLFRGKAVGRLTFVDRSEMKPAVATGFLISPYLVMTNHHVFTSKDSFENGKIEFNYEYDVDGSEKQKIVFELDPGQFFFASKTLDFSLVAVKPVDVTNLHKIEEQGYLVLNGKRGKIGKGDFATIIQHPEGKLKQIALRQNQVLDIQSSEQWITYYSDTAPGSSGSPVFNNEWQLIALHSAGVPKMDGSHYLDKNDNIIEIKNGKIDESQIVWLSNKGIRISAILAILESDVSINTHPLILSLFSPSYSDSRSLSFLSLPKVDEGERKLIGLQPNAMERPTSNITINIGTNDKGVLVHSIGTVLPDIQSFEKQIEEELDFSSCKGFDEYFLGFETPLPELDKELKSKIAYLLDNPNLYVLKYHHYSVVQHAVRKMPVYSAINILAGERYKELDDRVDKWFRDKRLDFDLQLNDKYYAKSGFDRGHMARREDAEWGKTMPQAELAANMTCSYVNACPQVPALNRSNKKGLWGLLEKEILEKGVKKEEGQAGKICVYTGPIFENDDPVYIGIQVPLKFWKLVVWLDEDDQRRATAFTLSQEKLVSSIDFERLSFDTIFEKEQRSIAELEVLTGLRFGEIGDWDTYQHKVEDHQRAEDANPVHERLEMENEGTIGRERRTLTETSSSREQVAIEVIDRVSVKANIKPHLVTESQILTKRPLHLGPTRLRDLWVVLQEFVQLTDRTKSILFADVSKADQTVGGLIDVVFKIVSTP